MKITSKKTISILAVLLLGTMILNNASADAVADPAYLISVTGTSILPSTVYAGDTASIAVTIQNIGSIYPIEDLNAVLDIGNQFEDVSLQQSIAQIKAGSTTSLVFQAKAKENTLPGYYPVFLTMNYNRNSVQTTQTQTILVPVSKASKNLDVTISPTVINPGNQTELAFTISNIGGTPVSNISFSWTEASNLILPLGSDNKRYISGIEPNKQAQITYNVAADPNITTGLYTLDVTMSFNDSNGTKTQVSQVGLVVGGKTDFEISADSATSGQVSVSIANIGSNNASAVVVKIPQQQGVTLSGSSTAILGNLNKGDYTIASFQIQFGGAQAIRNTQTDVPSSQQGFNRQFDQNTQATRAASSVTIQIEYTDTTGERQSVQKTIQLSEASSAITGATGAANFRNRQSSGAFSFLPWILLAVFAIGGAAFNKFKAKKNWKKTGIIIAIIAMLFLAVIFLFSSGLIETIILAIVSIVLLVLFFRKGTMQAIIKKIGLGGK